MKKIAINALTANPGGGLSVVRQFAQVLASIGYEVDVFLGTARSTKVIREAGIKNVNVKLVLPWLPAYLRLLIGKFIFLAVGGYKAVITPNYHSFSRGKTITLHVNLFSFMENPDGNSVSEKLKRLDAGLACRLSDVNIFESGYIEGLAKEKKGRINNSQVLYMPISDDFYRKPEGPHIAKSEVVVISSPNKHKNNDVALRAFSIFREQHNRKDINLVFFGGQSASDWNEYQGMAAELSVENNVLFEGPRSAPELTERLNSALCSMTCSSVESFCMVAIESMAAYCPVVASNATSMPESLGGAGVICKDRDPDSFAVGLGKMLDDDRRAAFVEKGIARASRFRMDVFSSQLEQLLD